MSQNGQEKEGSRETETERRRECAYVRDACLRVAVAEAMFTTPFPLV